MNLSTFVFGDYSNKIQAYPSDSTTLEVVKVFCDTLKSNSQIAIHRDGDIMYYAYVQRLSNNRKFGLCIVLNGALLNNIEKVDIAFDVISARLIDLGLLIGVNKEGDWIATTDAIYSKPDEVERVRELLMNQFSGMDNVAENLPPTDYSKSRSSQKTFDVNHRNDDIVQASHQYGYTFVVKEYDNILTTSFKNVLKERTKEVKDLQKENEELLVLLNKERHKKKQTLLVSVLILVLLALGVGFYFLRGAMKETSQSLDHARDTIGNLNANVHENENTIAGLKVNVSRLERRLIAETSAREEAEQQVEELQERVNSLEKTLRAVNDKKMPSADYHKSGSASSTSRTVTEPTTTTSETVSSSTQSQSIRYSIVGKIGDYPFHMTLVQEANGKYSGTYYYDKYPNSIYDLSGTLSLGKVRLKEICRKNGKSTGSWVLSEWLTTGSYTNYKGVDYSVSASKTRL